VGGGITRREKHKKYKPKLTYINKCTITQSTMHQKQKKHKINTENLTPGLVASYDFRPGNKADLF